MLDSQFRLFECELTVYDSEHLLIPIDAFVF
jgi:hypothetical protein